MLKRTFFYYLLLAILLLRMNFDIIHHQRLGYLGSLYRIGYKRSLCQNGKQENSPFAPFLYFDYARRVNPQDVYLWIGLTESYLDLGEPAKARETLTTALKIIPKYSRKYPLLLDLSKRLDQSPDLK